MMYLIEYASVFFLLYGEVISDHHVNIPYLKTRLGYSNTNLAKNHCLDVLLTFILDRSKMFPNTGFTNHHHSNSIKTPFAEMPSWAWMDLDLLVALLFIEPRAIHTLPPPFQQNEHLLSVVLRRISTRRFIG